MPKVLITGMSGTGTSAALKVLGERGHRVVDTDTDQWSHWVTSPDGSAPVTPSGTSSPKTARPIARRWKPFSTTPPATSTSDTADPSPLPTFGELNSFENTAIYSVGATFGRFVVDTRGRDAWLALIRSNGDIGGVLGLGDQAFLDEWAAFVRRVFHVRQG